MGKYIPSSRINKAVSYSLTPHKERIIQLYQSGMATRAIAKEIGNGTAHTAIYKAVIRWGVKEDRDQWNKGKRIGRDDCGKMKVMSVEDITSKEERFRAEGLIMEQIKQDARAWRGIDGMWIKPWTMEKARKSGLASYCRNRERIIQCQRERFQRIKHTEKYMERRTNYRRKYRKDPCKRIKHNLSVRMAILVRGIANGRKFRKSTEMLGCTEGELKAHLERMFTKRMRWDNYGSYWHVDHIVPISYFNLLDEQDMMRGCHYTNLRPLKAIENMIRGNRVGMVQPSLAI